MSRTAGSCSVMFNWPMRRTVAAQELSPFGEALAPEASGTAARPALSKVRRLIIGVYVTARQERARGRLFCYSITLQVEVFPQKVRKVMTTRRKLALRVLMAF